MQAANTSPGAGLAWAWRGLGLGLPLAVLALVSGRFAYQLPLAAQPIWLLVVLLLISGGFYLWAVRGLPRSHIGRDAFLWMLLLGLVLRLLMLGSEPILEDDAYRYLWDGAVSAAGLSPYQYSPQEALQGGPQLPPAMAALAAEAGQILQRVNHPQFTTIYLPVSQAAFALAYVLGPWSLEAWRLVLLAFDAASLCLLYLLIKRLGLPLMHLAVYWWNPLLIKEIYNSGHMEVVIFPFLLGALLLALHDRRVLAAGALGLAVGAKLWPAILLPVLLRPLLKHPLALAGGLSLFTAICALMLLPVLAAGLDASAGLVAYAGHWQMNDSAFMLLLWAAKWVVELWDGGAETARWAARVAVALLLAAWTFWLVRRPEQSGAEMVRCCLLATAALFLLSPTQFPWYYLWLLPFLALQPLPPLLWLGVLLPIYYLRFMCVAQGQSALYDHWLVWLIYLPVWTGLFWHWRRGTMHTGETEA